MKAIVFTHPSILRHLSEPPWKLAPQTRLIEMAQTPYLSYALGLETPASYPGIAGFLDPQIKWDELFIESDTLPHYPILLAPQATTVEIQLAGLIATMSNPELKQACLLMPLASLPELASLLAYTESIYLAWDSRVLPGPEITTLGTSIGKYCSKEQWQGLHVYNVSGLATDAQEMPAILQQWLQRQHVRKASN